MIGPSRLKWLVRQVWPDMDGRVLVTPDSPPPGYRIAEQYIVAPSISRARFLIPSQSSRLSASALSAYSKLRQPRTRRVKQLAAVLFRSTLGSHVFRDRLNVCVRSDVNEYEFTNVLLLSAICLKAGIGEAAALGVNEVSPNRKPVLQLFHSNGDPAGFVKVGSTPLTSLLVRRETDALDVLDRGALSLPRRPKKLLGTNWNGSPILVTSPMPVTTRLHDVSEHPPPAIELAVACANGALASGELSSSRFWLRLRERIEALRDSEGVPNTEFQTVQGYAEAIERRAGAIRMHFGVNHGDWSPWNIGWADGTPWVWDWENLLLDGPLGLDAAHYQFQRAHLHYHLSVQDALRSSAAQSSDHFTVLGLGRTARRSLIDIHLLDLYLRAAEMNRLGAGWNERFHLPAVEAMAERG